MSEISTILANAGHIIKHASLGDYVKDKVPSLKTFLSKGNAEQDYNIPSLAALSSAMRLLERYRLLYWILSTLMMIFRSLLNEILV